jgi:hypothetical protein
VEEKRVGKPLILSTWKRACGKRIVLVIGSFTSESYIKIIDKQARLAAQEFAKTRRIRVRVQDNGAIHKLLVI